MSETFRAPEDGQTIQWSNLPASVQALQLAQSAAKPHTLPEDHRAVVIPADASVALVNFGVDAYRDRPLRKKGTVFLHSAAAFNNYVDRWLNESTLVYANRDNGTLTAVLNESGPDELAFEDHRAVWTLEKSPEWNQWAEISGELYSQVAFAEFLEDHLEDIHAPDAATLLELVQTFEASSDHQFKSSTRLASGQVQLKYEENIKATGGVTGELTIPTEIVLALAPYKGTAKFEVRARFRYRIKNGQLLLGIKIVSIDRVLDAAFEKAVASVQAVFTDADDVPGLLVLAGAAPRDQFDGTDGPAVFHVKNS